MTIFRVGVTSLGVVQLLVGIGFPGRIGLLIQPEPRDSPDDQAHDGPAPLVKKSGDADLLCEMIGLAAERLMELEVRARIGAEHGEKSGERLA